ncbi:DUF6924 domain-containing protein [Streptomyces clavifer]|uniref:DUF6924 domain-containing protein n=1 Tax=Streptomyces clavifer TaxID=68188 RepID=UPI0033A19588
MALESLDTPPCYTPSAIKLPSLVHETHLLVRTDFSDDAAWASLVERVCRGSSRADLIADYVGFEDDPAFAGAIPEQVMAQVCRPGADLNGITSDVLLIADATTTGEPDQRLRVIPMKDEIGFTFRVASEAVGIVVVDLALSSMGIEDWREDDA